MAPRARPLRERFWEKVTRAGDDECWIWSGWKYDRQGHGGISLPKPFKRGEYVIVHRLAYELLVGPIPEGHVIHHKCHVGSCVNPRHLVPMTPSEHSATHPRPRPTHCKSGHEFTDANTRHYRDNGYDKRSCRTCDEIRWRERNARRSARRAQARQTILAVAPLRSAQS